MFIELSTLLTERFEAVSLLYPNNSFDESHYSVSPHVKRIPVGKVSNGITRKVLNVFLSLREVKKLLDHDPSVISIISDPILSIFYMVLPKRYKARTYRFVQADDYRIFDDLHVLKHSSILAFYKKLCLKSYLDIKNLIFNSAYTYNQFKDLVPESNAANNLVQPGIDTAIFCDKKIRTIGKLNICLVARKHPWKGFVDFIDAWESLENGVKDNVGKISIISHDDLSNFTIPEIAEVIKPKSDVEISTIMNQSHIFISTSWWEGFGLPPLEAMACGCAVISSNSKGILEYAVHGHNCITYEPKKVDQLARAMIDLLVNETLRKKLVSVGVSDAKNFSWDHTADQFSTIIQEQTSNFSK